jgi:selenocysteine-specific elongation factor
LLEAALALRLATAKEIAARSRLESASAQTALTDLLNTGSLIALEAEKPTSASDLLLMPRPYWHELQEKIIRTVEAHHKKYPLRRGIQREELKSKLRLSTRDFHAILRKLITDGYLLDSSTILAKPEHEVRFDRVQMEKVQVVMRRFEQTPYSPPSVKDVQAALNEEILNALMESGQLVTVSSEVLFRRQDYDVMVNTIQQEIRQKGRITLSEVRDLFNTSRKYAQALLEHLDTIGVTTRVGDFRTLQ